MKHLFIFLLIAASCSSPKEICGFGMPGSEAITVQFVEAHDTEALEYELFGTSLDVNSGEPFPFVKVKLTDRNDSTYVVGAFTDLDGKLSIKCREAAYVLQVSYAGFRSFIGEIVGFEEVREGIEIRMEE